MEHVSKALDRLISESLALEIEDAREAGALGFMARALVQATMPHRNPECFFERTNGAFTLTMMASPKVGSSRKRPTAHDGLADHGGCAHPIPELTLGDSLSGFIRELGMVPTGGRWGTITRLREQSRRLFTAAVSCAYKGTDRDAEMGFPGG